MANIWVDEAGRQLRGVLASNVKTEVFTCPLSTFLIKNEVCVVPQNQFVGPKISATQTHKTNKCLCYTNPLFNFGNAPLTSSIIELVNATKKCLG
jgi:hypothetical protein